MNSITEKGSFLFGAVRDEETVYLACSNDNSVEQKIRHSVFMQWDAGELGHIGQFQDYCAGVAVVRSPKEQMLAVSELGELIYFGSGEHSEGMIELDDVSIADKGPLRDVKWIGSSVVVVGVRNQVYVMDTQRLWIDHSNNSDKRSSDEMYGYESVDGFSEADFYCVGWNGVIDWFNKGVPVSIDSPTNLILTDVCAGKDGTVYACGQSGTFLIGREHEWVALEHDISLDFWSVCYFKDTVYVTSYAGIHKYENGALVDVTPFDCSYYSLDCTDDTLWSFGAKTILSFDGNNWKQVV